MFGKCKLPFQVPEDNGGIYQAFITLGNNKYGFLTVLNELAM
jgi:hypothetical protein